MTTFSVGESKPKKFKLFAALIMWFEGTKYSHVFITWKDNLGLRWVAEAKGSGIRMLSNKQFKEKASVVNIYNYDSNQVGINKLTEYSWQNMAKSYGYAQIYGLLEMRVLNKLYRGLGSKRKAINRFTDGEASQICCEFAIRCIEAATGATLVNGDLEQWGLREMQEFNLKNGNKQPKLKIDKINGVI